MLNNYGVFYDGVFYDGVFYDGVFYDGVFYDGVFYDGVFWVQSSLPPPFPFYTTQMINPFLISRVSANYDKRLGF